MKKYILFILLTQNAYSQNLVDSINFIEYKMPNIVDNLVFDTVPAFVPTDYLDYCECTEVNTISDILSFEDVYRQPFSNKTPARYMLCSFLKIDTMRTYQKDTSIYLMSAKVVNHKSLFSPYYLNYWNPNVDALEEEYLSGDKIIYDSIEKQLQIAMKQEADTMTVYIYLYLNELHIIKECIKSPDNNIFLLSINGFKNDKPIVFQFFKKNEYNVNTLYTTMQYYKYLKNRYIEYMKKRSESKNQMMK